MAKMHKATVKKAHRIARAIGPGKGRNAYAIGSAVAKKQAAKRKRARGK